MLEQQPDLFSQRRGGHIARAPIADDFWEFHRDHPRVYSTLVFLARKAKAAGADRLGMKQLFEVCRWEYALETRDWSGMKLNNNYTSYYARLIMQRNPDLDGIFETRRLHGRYRP